MVRFLNWPTLYIEHIYRLRVFAPPPNRTYETAMAIIVYYAEAAKHRNITTRHAEEI